MKNMLVWLLRLLVAGILLQTLFFKFSGAPESVWIFRALGAEPWGRIASGVAELVVAALILWPRTTGIGAVGSLGIISGAIVAHLTMLGIEVQGDDGTLFYLALLVFAGSAVLVWLHRREIPVVGKWFA